jgi:hypothetical protein
MMVKTPFPSNEWASEYAFVEVVTEVLGCPFLGIVTRVLADQVQVPVREGVGSLPDLEQPAKTETAKKTSRGRFFFMVLRHMLDYRQLLLLGNVSS